VVVAPVAHVGRRTASSRNSTRPVGAAVVTTAEATAIVMVGPDADGEQPTPVYHSRRISAVWTSVLSRRCTDWEPCPRIDMVVSLGRLYGRWTRMFRCPATPLRVKGL
jgi:hypothetical protein